jgi:ATP-dependent 26S proteasome regulatory subunit
MQRLAHPLMRASGGFTRRELLGVASRAASGIHEKEALNPGEFVGPVPAALQGVLEMLQHKERANIMGLSLPNVLLTGPAGSGKTQFARFMASLANMKVSVSSAAELFKSSLVGGPVRALDELFDTDGLVFLDELDCIGRRNNESGGGECYYQSGITHLLTKLDGFGPRKHALVIGATNVPSAIDPALLRPGRFELLVELPLPDEHTRAKLIQHHARAFRYLLPIDFVQLGRATAGFSQAEASAVPRMATLRAFREHRDAAVADDFATAVRDIFANREAATKSFLPR